MKKTVNPLGTFLVERKEKPVEFVCDRCLENKKSKNVVEWQTIEQETKRICNGCYGYLISTLKKNK
ncbi:MULTISPECIES: hypothetical protein [unclassified Carboxylicivirga]|uniref:hypothetical protein n=1 Tax=Carboxylicivirga TaxID=1628153 RepID=UPI003D329012